jgi:hypothetical protein
MAPTKPFSNAPATAKQPPTPFEVHINDQKLEDLKTLIRLSPVAKETYENQDPKGDEWKFGVPRSWILQAKRVWAEDFDWYIALNLLTPRPS